MTRDGLTNTDFHTRCDNKGATISLFKTSTGRRCGGYTTESWRGNVGFIADSKAFLISFDNQKIYEVK